MRVPTLAILILVAAPSLAHARFGHLDSADPTGLAIAREEVELRCEADGERDLACAIAIRWELVNDGESARTPEIGLSWDGEPSDVEVRVADAVLATEMPRHRRVRLLVPAHAHVALELRARQRVGAYLGTGSEIPAPVDPHDALAARHPLLATRWEIVRRGFAWLRPSTIDFESVGPTTIRFALPEGWEANVSGQRAPARSEDGHTFTWTPEASDRDAAFVLGVEMSKGVHTELFRNGGPFLALGATYHFGGERGEYTSFRGRIGYEIGLGEWALVSVSADSDFERQVVLTPLVELATYSLLIGPSLSAGIGLPIEVTNGGRAGLRLETSATFYSVAFVASFDYWPNDGTWQIHLLGRIGL